MKSPYIVGKEYLTKKGKKKFFKYSNVKFDGKGWADPQKYLPLEFDLCLLKLEQREKHYSGYWTGQCWDGANIKKDHTIQKWKRISDPENPPSE